MTAIPMRAFAIGAASRGALHPLAPAVLARTVAVLQDRTPAPPAIFVRSLCLVQLVRRC